MSNQLQEPVIYLEQSDFDQNLSVPALQGLSVLMIQGDFCGYCTQMKPIFQEVANNLHGKVNFVTIQVDSKYPNEKIFQNEKFVNAFVGTNLPGVPFIVKMIDGRVVPNSNYQGNKDPRSLYEWIVTN